MRVIEGWKNVTVEDCCEILDNKRVPVNAEERETRVGNVPYYGANGLQGYIDAYLFDEPLILIAEDGGYFDEFATRPIAYRIFGKSWVNNHAHVLRAKAGYCQNAIFYALEHKDIQPFIVGGTRAKLNQSGLRAITLTLPESEEEQNRIATILSNLDKAIEQTEAIVAKHQRTKTGLMQDLLAKGIDERGVIRSEATHEFKDSPLGRIPVEWEVNRLGNVASHVTSGSRGWARFYSNEGAVFLRIGNLTREHINFRFDDVMYVNVPESSEGKRTVVQEGDLLLSITADLGIIAVVPKEFSEAYVNQHIALIRLNKEAVVPRFIGHLLSGFIGQMQIDKVNESGAKAGLNLPTIENLLVFKPTQSEQEKIVDILDGTDTQIAGDKIRIDKLRHLKTGLMHDLLTGKVRVKPEAVSS
jgi:type I restriction enzyme, S subunit